MGTLEVIQEAINQLLVEENGSSVHRRSLLSELRSQLDLLTLEQEAKVEVTTTTTTPPCSSAPAACLNNIDDSCCCDDEIIMKELKNIKRQNLITHGLVSAMIVVTLTWQVSQVSLIFKIKHVISSPLESLGGIVKRFFNGQPKVDVVQQVMKQTKEKVSFDSTSSIAVLLKMLELPHLELPAAGLDTSEEEEEGYVSTNY